MRGFVAAVVMACLLAATTARADEAPDVAPVAPAPAASSPAAPAPAEPAPAVPPPVAPPPAPPVAFEPAPLVAQGPEIGLGAIQIVVGSVTMLLTLIPIGALGQTSDGAAFAGLLFAPLAGGFVVCAVGATSRYYDAGCGAPVLGAYLGVLTAIPLTFLGCSLDEPQGDVGGCRVWGALGLLTGYLVGTAGGATLAWHLAKKPRAQTTWSMALPPTPAPSAWPELNRRWTSRHAGEARVMLPLLSLAF